MADEGNDPFAEAQALYTQTLTPAITSKIRGLLQAFLANPGSHPQRDVGKAWALLATIIVCDYLNRWNGTGTAALDEAQQAADNARGVARAHHAQGFIHRARGRHDDAYKAFEQAARLKTDFARARAQKANELLLLGQPDRALRDIDQTIQAGSDPRSSGMFHWIKGRILFFLGNYGDAIPCLEASISTWTELWYNRLYLVSAYALTGRQSEASNDLQQFQQQFPGYATIAEVIEAEETNPDDNPFVVAGRESFHQGLRLAGMAEG